ncbi:MAM and LDL-receptor class A domain-containing protein 1-like [Branchiostoma floridae]|uniref:MAM and LDL-receptor class A domain-containing protein 1-like n=1 Tax=Branchiostoma floridae TaxID=7739 RepID=A0A9J7M685_BRAFL|nr:MAM and LDL-receptor class A domain-containing protein 1-like [Branchiostoma floridae]
MHIDGTGQSLGKKARLKSPLIFERGDFCLEFYYHMYGSTVGSLNVYRDSTSNRVWSMSGNQGNAWQKASVDFSSSSSYFQIIFEGVRGSWDNGDIAIDDVEIKNHACGAVPTGTGDCNFESSDICGYTHDRTHDFDWQRHRGSTLSSGTGPSQDHTTGTGYYMYMETTLPATGDKARLVSPAIVGGGTKCLQFWYHMYGSRTGTLAVVNKVYDQTTLGTRLWSLSGNQGDAWKRARVTLTPTASYFQIVFEGTNGGFFSDIAVDDIDVDDGSCRDVNECLVDAQACSPHAQCTNTADGYECTCRPGYSGNGHLCEALPTTRPPTTIARTTEPATTAPDTTAVITTFETETTVESTTHETTPQAETTLPTVTMVPTSNDNVLSTTDVESSSDSDNTGITTTVSLSTDNTEYHTDGQTTTMETTDQSSVSFHSVYTTSTSTVTPDITTPIKPSTFTATSSGVSFSTSSSVGTVSGLSAQQTLMVVGSVLGATLVVLSAALIYTVIRNRKSHDLRDIIERNGEVAMDDISDEKLSGFHNPSYGILQVTIRYSSFFNMI